MLTTTTAHLRIRRPSPTTAEFTVSTELIHPQPRRALLALLLWVARLATLLVSLLMLHTKYMQLLPALTMSTGSDSSSFSLSPWEAKAQAAEQCLPYDSCKPGFFHVADAVQKSCLAFSSSSLRFSSAVSSSSPSASTVFLTSHPAPVRNSILLSSSAAHAASSTPQSPVSLLSATAMRVLAALTASPWGRAVERFARATPAWMLVPAAVAAAAAALRRAYSEETVLVLRGLGIQTSSLSGWVVWPPWGFSGGAGCGVEAINKRVKGKNEEGEEEPYGAGQGSDKGCDGVVHAMERSKGKAGKNADRASGNKTTRQRGSNNSSSSRSSWSWLRSWGWGRGVGLDGTRSRQRLRRLGTCHRRCSGVTTRFIPTDKVRDVLVNEAFFGNEIKFYLLIVVEDEDDVVVVFENTLPGRDIVLEVWNGVRGCLWEGGMNPKWISRRKAVGGQ